MTWLNSLGKPSTTILLHVLSCKYWKLNLSILPIFYPGSLYITYSIMCIWSPVIWNCCVFPSSRSSCCCWSSSSSCGSRSCSSAQCVYSVIFSVHEAYQGHHLFLTNLWRPKHTLLEIIVYPENMEIQLTLIISKSKGPTFSIWVNSSLR